jgi:antitoxin component of MazEF toxin-antitoxin module
MIRTRTVRRVGGSLMISIPPEMAAGLGLGEGADVTLRSHAGVIEIEPADLGERLRAEAQQEAVRLRSDPAYAAEMQAVRQDMEAVRAW